MAAERKWMIWLIVLAYLVAGVLYAALTPAWQVPDEPAHYNYIRYLASHGRFPVLEQGDYPAKYLEEIKSRRFPTDMSIDPIRYEFHQPPLYYLLQVPVFIAFGGKLLPLRLLSVLLGALLLFVIYRSLVDLFPEYRWVSLMATAFVAFLPMHTAMMAGVENDSLAELLLALAIWLSLRLLLSLDPPGRRSLLRLGIVLGLILVTKTTVYVIL
jgi:4-amino-4-deoxy-L-arabinose transferase-like glycosyltransferase